MTQSLPKNWKMVRLPDCCAIVSGATPRRENSEYWGGDIPWVTPKDLSELDQPIISDTPEKITKIGYDSCSATLLPKGSILFSSRAPIGLVAIAGQEMCTNQGFKSLVTGPEVISEYLYWCMRYFTPTIQKMGRGATFKEVSKEVMERVEIPLAPLPEQKRIAAILDKADAIRRKRKESISLADTFLKSVFLDMFGDPVKNEKGWEIVTLAETFAQKPQIGTITPACAEGAIPVIRVGELGDCAVPLEQCGRVTLEIKDIDKFLTQPGDFFLARAIGSEAHFGKASILHEVNEPVVFDSHVMRLRFDRTKINPSFFYQWLKTSGGRARFMKQAGRTAVQFNINARQIANIEIPLPFLFAQEEYVKLCAKTRESLMYSHRSTARLDELFNSLLHRAFRGEV